MKYLLLASVFILFISVAVPVSAAGINDITDPNVVLVRDMGAWQWGVAEHEPYTLKETYGPDGEWDHIIYDEDKDKDFALQLLDNEENKVAFSHLVNSYTLQIKPDPRGRKHVRFYVSKNGRPCKTSSGRDYKYAELSNSSNTYIGDFEDTCGVVFEAEWETLTFETDVEIHNLGLSFREYDENIKARLKNTSKESREALKKLKSLSEEIRVFDLRGEFIPDNSGRYFILAGSFKMNEGDWWDSTRNRTIFITDNGNLKYMIMLKAKFSNDFYVVSAKDNFKNTKIYEVTGNKTGKDSWDELVNWEGWSGELPHENLDGDFWKEMGATVGVGGATGATTVAGLVVYDVAVTGMGSTVGGSLGFLASKAALTTSISGSAGILATPPGWIIAGAVAVGVLIGGTAYYLNETDLYSYDGGNLKFNWDTEVFTTQTEAKINHILVMNSAASAPDESVNVTIQFKDLDALKQNTSQYNSGQGYGMSDIAKGVYITDQHGTKLDVITNTKTASGNSIKFTGLTQGSTYKVCVEFEELKPIRYIEFVAGGNETGRDGPC